MTSDYQVGVSVSSFVTVGWKQDSFHSLVHCFNSILNLWYLRTQTLDNEYLDFFLPAALQSTCCLPEPWTKHITAPKQHGILLYLPTAASVLPPEPPLLRNPYHPSMHTFKHTHIHTHINIYINIYIHTHTQPSPCPPERMYWGMWGCPRLQTPPNREHLLCSSLLGLSVNTSSR